MQTAVEELEQALAVEFDRHPLAGILRSAPGLGPVLAARVLAEIGDDPTRFTTAAGLRAFAGTAPVTRASGRSRYVKARKVRNKRLGDACHWWAFVTITKSVGAREHYDRRRAAGDHHNAALRNLANKLIGRLWWCLQHHEAWGTRTPPGPRPSRHPIRPSLDTWPAWDVYLPVGERGFLYLATVIDLYSRRLGDRRSHAHRPGHRRPPRGPANPRQSGRSDHAHRHGAQCTSKVFAAACQAAGVRQSMSKMGSSADNALAESFNATFERETLQGRRAFTDEREARLTSLPLAAPLQHRPPPLPTRTAIPDCLREHSHHSGSTLTPAA
ncbi:transposase [Krasilnikovia sp. M28-CT-15]|uniref:transposase n=1 Tax=Krasilnikovia sp. M28-CT-15 TaxID=3373540 RepID=UPI003876E1EE